jgi:hypothetical protein
MQQRLVLKGVAVDEDIDEEVAEGRLDVVGEGGVADGREDNRDRDEVFADIFLRVGVATATEIESKNREEKKSNK